MRDALPPREYVLELRARRQFISEQMMDALERHWPGIRDAVAADTLSYDDTPAPSADKEKRQ